MPLIPELQRRNVIRVATAYVVAAWLIIQIAETTFPVFGFSDNAVRVVIIVLGIGLIPAIAGAWVFQLTPEGLERDKGADETPATSKISSRNFDRAIIITLVLGLTYFAVDKFVLAPDRAAEREAEVAEQARAEAIVGFYGDRSIAVLPFDNMSSDPEQEYFADGIAEEVLNLLAQIRELRVISRSSAFAFKGQGLEIPEIAERLDVAHILEGSVRKSGNKVRITAQLIEAKTDTHLWSQTYDRELEDIFAIQDEIATNIAERLEVTIGGTARGHRLQTDNVEAYEFYLKGRALLYQRGMAMFQACECFEDAIALDPQYALAHAGLADSYSILGYHGLIAPPEAWPPARKAAERAVALAPELAEAHNALAIIAFVRDWDWATTGREFRRSLELNPSYVQARCWYAMAYLQATREDHEAAIAEARVAVDIDPLSPYAHTMLGYVLTSAGRTEEGVEEARRGAESDPESYWGQFVLATAYHRAARLSEAEGAYERALSASERHPLALANLGRLYAEWEKPAEAAAVDAELSARSKQEYVQPITLSVAALSAGRSEAALGLLQQACEERDPWLAWGALTSPWFEPLRKFPEYGEILKRMKLPVRPVR